MSPIGVLLLVRRFGPWIVGALAAAYVAWLAKDHHRLAALDARRVACTAAVDGRPGAAPVANVCDPSVAAAVQAVALATACDSDLSKLARGVSGLCSAPVQRVAAARDALADEVADRDQQLAAARTAQAAAVSRAAARATTEARQDAHADQVLRAAPRDGAGALVLDADRLRELAGPDPAGRPAAGGGDAR